MTKKELVATIETDKDGIRHYYDKNGTELFDGDKIRWNSGRIQKLHLTTEGCLGVDATNPSWIESGRAVECEYGVYPLEFEEMEYVEKYE